MVCATGEPDWSGVTLQTFNQTLLLNPQLCNSCICPLELDGYIIGYMSYFPSLAGNAVFAAVFGLCLLPQLYLGVRYKTWGYLISMAGGMILEVLGYIARILMRDNMFTNTYFVMQVFSLLLFVSIPSLTLSWRAGTWSASPSPLPSSPRAST